MVSRTLLNIFVTAFLSAFVFFTPSLADEAKLDKLYIQLVQPDLLAKFLEGANDAGIVGLKGHKAVGGLRASLYNAVPNASIDTLSDYLQYFAQRHS